MMRAMHWLALQHINDVGCVDLRHISEAMRQKIIDLGMMEPPLVEVDADRVSITKDGQWALANQPTCT